MYKNLIVYYFTGTGNAKAVSNWIVDTFQENNIPTQIIEIKKGLRPDVSTINSNTLIGFCYPTHGFNAPPVVLDFIARFPKTVKAKFFVLNTQAGMKLYKIFLPGLSELLCSCLHCCFELKDTDALTSGQWICLRTGYRCIQGSEKKLHNPLLLDAKELAIGLPTNSLQEKGITGGWHFFL